MTDTHDTRPTPPRPHTDGHAEMGTPRETPRGRSPQRPIRIPDDVWYPAVARSKAEGDAIGHIVTAFLRDYARGDA